MPVQPRPVSEMGYYHIAQRGNGKQVIFEEPADYIHFLQNLKQYSADHRIIINAFCLMENHFHLLICDAGQNKSLFMKRLSGNYAIWFNKKYERSGHLFQNRYTCRAIESDDALCTVFRYILNNPRDAGLCSAADYQWSSYSRYGHPNSFVDTTILTELIGSFEEYAAYIDAKYEDNDQKMPVSPRDDEWAKTVMQETLHVNSGTEIRSYSRKSRDDAVRLLYEKGLSIRQIERLTGVSKGVIQRAVKQKSGTPVSGAGVPE